MSRKRSAAVYRRRRLTLFLGLVLVLALIGGGVWVLIAQPWAGGRSPAPSPSASASPEESASSNNMAAPSEQATIPAEGDAPTDAPLPPPTEDETSAPAACLSSNITVEAITDAEFYAAGVLPKMSISLTNNGNTDCTMDVGSATQVFTISSGSDVWWTSTHCQQDPSSMIATIAAGQTVASAVPVEWDRTRSRESTCAEENRARAPGGGSSYHVGVSIGGFDSATTRQFFLN